MSSFFVFVRVLDNRRVLVISVAGLIFLSNIFSAYADDLIYESGNRRDPFIALAGAAAPPPPPPPVEVKPPEPPKPPPPPPEVKFDYKVEGIVFDPPAGSLVLINGEFFKEGQSVDGANVISILKDRVILAKSDKTKTLWIRDEIVSPGDKQNVSIENAKISISEKKPKLVKKRSQKAEHEK